MPEEPRDRSLRDPSVGLCADCHWHRIVEAARGSRFWRCRRAETDARFPKYPRLPVLACPGFEPVTIHRSER